MRVYVSSRIVSITVALSFLFTAAASQALAQGMYPPQGNCGYGVTAANPGQFSYQQQCGYPMTDNFAQCCEPPCGPRWSFAAEAIALQRSTTRNQSLFLSATGPTDVLNSRDLRFPVAFGPKVSGIRHGVFGSDFDVEVGYFQFDGFETNRAIPGSSRMVIDINYALPTTDSTARYASALYSGEVNVRWQWLDWLTVMSGFRMVELNEQYDGRGRNQIYSIVQDVNSFNHLYGYQLGAEGEIFNYGCLQIKALCKAGAFGNFASQNNQTVITGVASYSDSATNRRVSFLGEVGVAATYAITEQLAFRASYQAMWIEGVGLAPEQIDTTNFLTGATKVNLDGGVFYHGGGLGLEYRF